MRKEAVIAILIILLSCSVYGAGSWYKEGSSIDQNGIKYTLTFNTVKNNIEIGSIYDSFILDLNLCKKHSGAKWCFLDYKLEGDIHYIQISLNDVECKKNTEGICYKYNGDTCESKDDCLSDICLHNVCVPHSPFCGDKYCDGQEDLISCYSDCYTNPYSFKLSAEDYKLHTGYKFEQAMIYTINISGETYCDKAKNQVNPAGAKNDGYDLPCSGLNLCEPYMILEGPCIRISKNYTFFQEKSEEPLFSINDPEPYKNLGKYSVTIFEENPQKYAEIAERFVEYVIDEEWEKASNLVSKDNTLIDYFDRIDSFNDFIRNESLNWSKKGDIFPNNLNFSVIAVDDNLVEIKLIGDTDYSSIKVNMKTNKVVSIQGLSKEQIQLKIKLMDHMIEEYEQMLEDKKIALDEAEKLSAEEEVINNTIEPISEPVVEPIQEPEKEKANGYVLFLILILPIITGIFLFKSTNNKGRCYHCGAKIIKNDKFCGSCGKKVKHKDVTSKQIRWRKAFVLSLFLGSFGTERWYLGEKLYPAIKLGIFFTPAFMITLIWDVVDPVLLWNGKLPANSKQKLTADKGFGKHTLLIFFGMICAEVMLLLLV